jgi:hypothetical protein
LISSPTTRKKIVSRPWLIQSRSGIARACVPTATETGVSQTAVKRAPVGEFSKMMAISDISSRRKPAAGAQRRKTTVAEWRRWPRDPSIASDREVLSQVPS